MIMCIITTLNVYTYDIWVVLVNIYNLKCLTFKKGNIDYYKILYDRFLYCSHSIWNTH